VNWVPAKPARRRAPEELGNHIKVIDFVELGKTYSLPSLKFLGFYLASGIAGSTVYAAFHLSSHEPVCLRRRRQESRFSQRTFSDPTWMLVSRLVHYEMCRHRQTPGERHRNPGNTALVSPGRRLLQYTYCGRTDQKHRIRGL